VEEAHSPPYGYADDPTRYWKFIVINELQSIDKGNLNNLLYTAEIRELLEENRIVFIAMTMNEEEIMFKSRELYKALKGRAGDSYIPLGSFSNKQVIEFLNCFYPAIPFDIKEMIASYSEGSLRTAIGAVTKLANELAYSTNNATAVSSIVASDVLGVASISQRRELWRLLKQSGVVFSNYQAYNLLKEHWLDLTQRVSLHTLVNQLLNDLDDSISQGYVTPDQQQALITLHGMIKPSTVSSWHKLIILRGLDIINPTLLKHEDQSALDQLLTL
jgi:hypothetical protein